MDGFTFEQSCRRSAFRAQSCRQCLLGLFQVGFIRRVQIIGGLERVWRRLFLPFLSLLLFRTPVLVFWLFLISYSWFSLIFQCCVRFYLPLFLPPHMHQFIPFFLSFLWINFTFIFISLQINVQNKLLLKGFEFNNLLTWGQPF